MTEKIYIVIIDNDLPAEVCHGEEKLQKHLAMLDETNPTGHCRFLKKKRGEYSCRLFECPEFASFMGGNGCSA